MHTWTFDKDSFIIRAYLWLYLADPTRVDFCKLFWGVVFSPIAVLFRGFLALIFGLRAVAIYVARPIAALLTKLPRPHRNPRPPRPVQEKVEKNGPSLGERILGWFTTHGYILDRLLGVVVVLAILGAAAVLISLAIQHPIALLYLLGVFVGAAVLVGIVTCLIMLFESDRFREGRKALWEILVQGHHHVKDRTCPIIEIEGLEADHA